MKRLFTTIVIFFIAAQTISASVLFGKRENINSNWQFAMIDKDTKIGVDKIEGWKEVDLPHDWSVRGRYSPDLFSATGYLPGGIGLYKKSIVIPAEKSGDKVFLYFEGIYNRSEVYLNGNLLGKRPNGYISLMYDATDNVKFGEENEITVIVDHSRQADSRWYTGSGIYRDVWMITSNKLHIAPYGVYATTSESGELNVETELVNELDDKSKVTIVNELTDASGKVVAKSQASVTVLKNLNSKSSSTLKVSNPALWSLETPNLYTLTTSIYKSGELVDQSVLKTGFRTFKFDPNSGFTLNGESMKMKGVCLHHDSGVLGSAFYRSVWKRRIETLKSLGCNAIRTSHNAQSPVFYQLCDEIGMLVLNEAYDEWEFPKRKWIDGWNVGVPGYEGTYDYFAEFGERDLADMVRRDRNHPSIFGWSIGNEVDYPNDPYSHPALDGGKETGFTQPIFGGYKKDAPNATRLGDIAKKLAAVVREFDPSRAVTAGLAGVAMSNETEYPFALDLCGYNYTESKYQSDHEKYPNRVIYGSENRHDYDAWKAVIDNDHIFGQFLWTGIDYLGESGSWPSRGFYSGLLDFGGFEKPRGYFRKALWSDKPTTYIGTYLTPIAGAAGQAKDVLSQFESTDVKADVEKMPSMDAWSIWNYENGQSIRVVCYTNSPKAKLMLNGKQVGEVRSDDRECGMIYWDIPYSAGKLEAVGLNANGEEMSRYAIESTDRPYALKAEIVSDDSELVQIVVNVVDEKGRRVMLADNSVTCLLSEGAQLLGLEGSDNSDMGDYTDNEQRVFKGQLVAYIKAGENGCKVKFTSPLLESVTISVK